MLGYEHLPFFEAEDPAGFYHRSGEGIWRPALGLKHRDEEYDSAGFDILAKMQEDHFWYRGRHLLIDREFQHEISVREDLRRRAVHIVDLGGGCGGWVKFLMTRRGSAIAEAALADSSLLALRMAQSLIGNGVSYYQADLMNLGWDQRWDIAFLLDVLEHLPDDIGALKQARRALRPKGLLLMTVPALPFFWSYNDVIAKHLRRYDKRGLEHLASESGFRLLRARYFMVLLSPLILLRRLFSPDVATMSSQQIHEHVARTHLTPLAPINSLLTFLMALEERLGRIIPYPGGASLLGVLEKNE